jgi:hypothetical protein
VLANISGVATIAKNFGNSSLVLKTDGTVWAWGDNNSGQLGNGSFGGGSYPTPAPVIGFGGTISYPCMVGTVNSGSGVPVDVLLVNGSIGNANRIVDVGVNTPITVDIAAPPAGPNPSLGVLWAWLDTPTNPTTLTAFGQTLGCIANPPSFIPNLSPQPVATIPFYAPFTIASATGFPTPIIVTLQGVEIDFGSAAPVSLGITNAVIVNVQ